jgi:hypothetical protein
MSREPGTHQLRDLKSTPALTVEQVKEQLGSWFLVGESLAGNEEGGWSYHTTRRIQVRDLSGAPMLFSADYVALPVRKVDPTVFAYTVLIGRAQSNDVCIDHGSVSKLHARIRLGDGGQPSAISDAGSANGTLVQDERIEAETWVDLGPDMDITFGDREFTLLSAERLAEILDGL